MATHLLCALSTRFSTFENVQLIKMHRVTLLEGYYTLSDILIGDDDYYNHVSSISSYTNLEQLYKLSVNWNHVYIPSLEENIFVYEQFYKWFPTSDRLIKWLTFTDRTHMYRLACDSLTNYTRACFVACCMLRILIDSSIVEIQVLCKDMLNELKTYITSEVPENELFTHENKIIVKSKFKK